MHFQDNVLIFDRCDLYFVKRFGPIEATRMVEDFRACHCFPFLYDTYQLSAFFGILRKRLFELSRTPEKFYYPVLLNKRSGGVRRLHVPFLHLRHIQQRILRSILYAMPISRYATAYRKGCSIVDNASVHCGKAYLLKMDICDFFGSIRFDQIYSAVFHTGHFPKQIGAMLTSLCCYQERLPQGAPTSPALSNLVMRHFDDIMGEWCEKRGIAYTRYSDDLTFSSDRPLYTAYVKAKSLLEAMGFELNEKKTCFVTNASRKHVTGIVVNEDHPTISREDRRALRQELYFVEKFGVADAIVRGNRTAFMKDGKPLVHRYLDHLEGRVRYVLHVMKDEPSFQQACRMLRRVRETCERDDTYTSYYE